VRLFDRGALNTYENELQFLLTVAICSHTADMSPSLAVNQLEKYHSKYSLLLTEISQLMDVIKSWSVDAMFQAVFTPRLVAVIRRYVAARWLRRVLTCNNVTVDDMQHIESVMLDTSVCWYWLQRAVNVYRSL